MSDILSPAPKLAFFDSAGAPLSGGLLFTYAAGTVNKQNTFTDSTGGTPNANPIVLDSRGECECWLDPTLLYKFVLSPSTDTDPPANPIWTVDNVGNTVVIAGQISKLGSVAGTNAYTGTSSYAVSAYADGMVYLFVPSATNTGAVSLNVSGLGPKNVYVAGSACVGGEFQAGIAYLLEYSNANSRFDLLNVLSINGLTEDTSPDPLNDFVQTYDASASAFKKVKVTRLGSVIAGASRNLVVTTPAGTSTTITATEVLLEDSNGSGLKASSVNLTVNGAVNGANGLDTGALALTTWYYGYVIGKPDGTIAGLISASATAPTMPTGYTYKALVAAFRTAGGGAAFRASYQYGNRVTWLTEQFALTGGNAAVLTSVSLSPYVPPIALNYDIRLNEYANCNGSGNAQVNYDISIDGTTVFVVPQLATFVLTAASGAYASSGQFTLPNVGGAATLYYEVGPIAGTGTMDISVLGFTLPGPLG